MTTLTFQEQVLKFISINAHSTCTIAGEFGLGCKSMRRFLIKWKKKKLVKLTTSGLWKKVITK
jgi:hypothetical protein